MIDMLYKMILTFESVDENIQTKDNEQYFPLVLFIMLNKVILAIESLYEILKRDHSALSSAGMLFVCQTFANY